MKLYVVRHAIAVARGTPGIPEDERPLTEEGIRKMKKVAQGLKRLQVSAEVIISSPLPRARQTAEIVVAALGTKCELKLSEALAPSARRPDVYREIRDHEEVESLMIVGHQPSLGEIAGEIAWGSSGCYVELKKGGACALDIERFSPVPRGTLLWLLTPSILRELAS